MAQAKAPPSKESGQTKVRGCERPGSSARKNGWRWLPSACRSSIRPAEARLAAVFAVLRQQRDRNPSRRRVWLKAPDNCYSPRRRCLRRRLATGSPCSYRRLRKSWCSRERFEERDTDRRALGEDRDFPSGRRRLPTGREMEAGRIALHPNGEAVAAFEPIHTIRTWGEDPAIKTNLRSHLMKKALLISPQCWLFQPAPPSAESSSIEPSNRQLEPSHPQPAEWRRLEHVLCQAR